MKWESYKKKIKYFALSENFDNDYIKKLLNYAKQLFDNDLPVIYDSRHLSLLLGYKQKFIFAISNKSELFYRIFHIDKKNGMKRTISEPLPSLKNIQNWILNEILYKCKPEKFCKSFQKNKSIIDNAKFHKNKKIILTLDIKDFFPSIGFNKVYYLFRKLGYSKSVSILLSNLCCLNRILPQGAPTSPMISNLVMARNDRRIGAFCVKNNINYTRYADDLTFSGDFPPGKIINFVEYILAEDNFELNKDKTRTKRRHQRQLVTGIVVNDKMQVSREIRRKIRQDVYYINKFGLDSHLNKREIMKSNYLKHLLGILNFIIHINPKDKMAINYNKRLKEIL